MPHSITYHALKEGIVPDPQAAAKAQEATHDFIFRPATPADIPALADMIERSLRGLSTKDYTPAELDGSIGFLFGPDSLLISDSTYFILHPVASPSTICACGGWSFRRTLYGADTAPGRKPEARDPNNERASIRAIFTHPDWARKGLGTMVMRYCEERAREKGFLGLEMGSTLTGVSLYERCGYEKSGKMDEVLCPNGAKIRVVHMTKDLAGFQMFDSQAN
ncbi:acyl-CoA N-acyltransferase [Lojkania enalia]|uniref:Acyl-CoA N-acyltransferase n=1 Tax=Lojkania enalia TaxID=147567 RepID=A0A9P4KFD6_9PLEO|nr:acyl-CoA N-acyltransferase [Didymosphaeria enalia]